MKYGATQITDEELAAQMEREKEELERTWAPPRGLRGWFTDTDHKAIAIRYIVTECYCGLAVYAGSNFDFWQPSLKNYRPNWHHNGWSIEESWLEK